MGKLGEFLRCQHAVETAALRLSFAAGGGFSCYVIMEGGKAFAGIGLCEDCRQALRTLLDSPPFCVVAR